MTEEIAGIFKPGDRAVLLSPHPWATHAGTVIAWETYGLGWKGWRVRLDEPFDGECYAKPKEMRLVR